MNRLYRYTFIFLFFACVLCVICGCDSDSDIIDAQRVKIETYLTGRGLLIEEVEQDRVYRHLIANTDPEPALLPVAEKGDSIIFNFEAYQFTGTAQSPFIYTNKREMVENQANLNIEYWDFTPRKVKIGAGEVIKGVDLALPNCKRGDSLHVFFTSDLGFGGKDIGLVPLNTPLMYYLTIEDVIKQEE